MTPRVIKLLTVCLMILCSKINADESPFYSPDNPKPSLSEEELSSNGESSEPLQPDQLDGSFLYLVSPCHLKIIREELGKLNPKSTGDELTWMEKGINFDMVGDFPAARYWWLSPNRISWIHFATFEYRPRESDLWQIGNQSIEPGLYESFKCLFHWLAENLPVPKMGDYFSTMDLTYEGDLYTSHTSEILGGFANQKLLGMSSGRYGTYNIIRFYNMLARMLYLSLEYGKLDVYQQVWLAVQCNELVRNKSYIPLPIFSERRDEYGECPGSPSQHFLFSLDPDTLWNVLMRQSLPSPKGEILFRYRGNLVALQWNDHFLNSAVFSCHSTSWLDSFASQVPSNYVHELEKRKLKVPSLSKYRLMLVDMVGICRGRLSMDGKLARILNYHAKLAMVEPEQAFQDYSHNTAVILTRFPEDSSSRWLAAPPNAPIVSFFLNSFATERSISNLDKEESILEIDRYEQRLKEAKLERIELGIEK